MGHPITGKPVIHYPCTWEYRIIGRSVDDLRAAVADILSDGDYSLTEANTSRQGRWLSMSLEVHVETEERRNAIHRALHEHALVKFVL